jgi:hypothetical protein
VQGRGGETHHSGEITMSNPPVNLPLIWHQVAAIQSKLAAERAKHEAEKAVSKKHSSDPEEERPNPPQAVS